MPARNRMERGFTMVELLVSVTLGMLLMIVIAELFLGSRQTYATSDDLARMQENMRYAQHLLSRTIHMAGFKSSPNTITNNVFSGANAVVGGTEGAGTAPDTITLRYQGYGNGAGTPDGTMLNCLGARVDAGAMSANTFSIGVGANGGNALFCNTGGGAVEVVPDVENMQVLYGEDTNADLSADRYVQLGDVTNMNNVVNLRIALLFRTTNLVNIQTDTKVYSLNGVNLPAFNDQRMRRVVTTTFNLRNRVP